MTKAMGIHTAMKTGLAALFLCIWMAIPSVATAQSTALDKITTLIQSGAPLTTEDENRIRSLLDEAEALRAGDEDGAVGLAKALATLLPQAEPRSEEQRERLLIFEFRSLRVLGEVAEARAQDAQATQAYKRIFDIALDLTGPDSDITASWRAAYDRSRSQPATRISQSAFDATLQRDHGTARELYQRVRDLRSDILGPAHPETLDATRSLAKAHSELGATREAIQLMSDMLELADPGHAPTYVSDLVTLSGFQDQAGQYREAGQTLTLAVEIAEEQLAMSHNMRLVAVNDLAVNLYKQGKAHEAAKALRKALDLRLAAQGPDHPETLTTMGNLGTVLSNLGQFDEAETLLRQAYTISDDLFGPDIPDTLTRASNLAEHLMDRGRGAQAETMLKDIIRRRNVQLGPSHPETLISLNNYANVLVQTGRAWEAESLFRTVLSARDAQLGPDHPDTLVSLNNLAMTLRILGRTDTAEAEFERVLAARLRLFGPGHPDVIGVMITLATLREDLGDTDEAEAMLREAYRTAQAHLGAAHPLTLTSANNLARLLTNAGELVEATPLMRETYETREAVLGEDHPSTLTSAVNVATLYRAQADHARAVDLLESALVRISGTLGDDHLDVLTARNNLAFSYLEMGQPGEALVHARAALSSRVPDAVAGLPLAEPRAQAARQAVRVRGRLLANATWAAAQTDPGGAEAALRAEGFLAVQTSRSAAADALSRSAGRVAVARHGLQEVVAKRTEAQGTLTTLDERELATAQDETLDEQTRRAIRADIAEHRVTALAEIDEADAQLRQDAPEFFRLISPDPVSIADLQGATGFGAAGGTEPLLRDDEALILIAPPDRGFPGLVWAVSRDRAAWSVIDISEDGLRARISRLHEMLDSPGTTRGAFSLSDDAQDPAGFDRAHAHALYQDLLGAESVQTVLQDKTTWLIAPQGMLLSLPFATLVSQAPQGGTAADADPLALRETAWLGLERAIAVIPEVASLRSTRSDQSIPKPSRDFFGLGDPVFAQATRATAVSAEIDTGLPSAIARPEDLNRLSPLPGTRAEIESFASFFSAANDAILLGAAANETQLAQAAQRGALSDARIVVLATHGLVAGAFDGLAEPALALTPPACGPSPVTRASDPGCPPSDPQRWAQLSQAHFEGAWIDDGLLTASEAAQLNLAAEWVILSACDTASGDGQSPDAEGLSGLAQAFFHAGAQSLLVSHWPVRDDVAARLTTEAVAGADRGLTRPHALREAMRALVMDTSADATGRSFAHPAAWAPFQVTGH